MLIGASNKTINCMAVMSVSIWETDDVEASDNVLSVGFLQYALNDKSLIGCDRVSGPNVAHELFPGSAVLVQICGGWHRQRIFEHRRPWNSSGCPGC
jgi:hypothetical protein